MNVRELPFQGETFKPFSVRIDIASKDELYALTKAAGVMCNGHGLEILDFLKEKCDECGVKL
jgi:hypothetical protein